MGGDRSDLARLGRSRSIMTRVTGAWLDNAATQRVFEVFEANGVEVFCVGGCVRNTLLGVPVSDVDMCTAVRPERVAEICDAAGLKVVPTGLSHGTVTAISSGTPFEITTFRKDVETDGRRAVVAFSERMEDDARRRDFTMNALYCTRDGNVIDPLGGLGDLRAGRVRFIEDPQQRIREDYLRILRFFRFFARFAKEAPDPDTLDAITRNLDGLSHVSVERITSELVSLLSVPNPAPATALLQRVGALTIVLPGADTTCLAPLVDIEEMMGLAPDPLPRLAILASDETLAALRLSKAQSRRISMLRDGASSGLTPEALGAQLGQDAAVQAYAMRCAVMSTAPAPDAAEMIAWGAGQTFPITAADLQPKYEGPALGQCLATLRQAWLASGLTLSKDALLSGVED
jgi:poly(A) polymerase